MVRLRGARAIGIAVGAFAFFNVYPGRPQIGVIDIPFTVIGEDSAFAIGEMLDYARRNDSIKAVVVKLTTPGGGAADSELLYHKMLSLREKKPVVVSSGWINAKRRHDDVHGGQPNSRRNGLLHR